MSDLRAQALLRGMATIHQQPQVTGGEELTDLDPEARCLAWAMRQLGDPRPLRPAAGGFVALLEANNIPYREVKTPPDLAVSTRNLMVVFAGQDGRPLVCHQPGLRPLLFDGRVGRVRPLVSGDRFKPFAYELYASLPSPLSSPLSLLWFSLSTNITPLLTVVLGALVVAVFNLSIPVLTSYLVSTVLPQGDLQLIVETALMVLLIAASTLASQAFSSLATVRVESLLNLRLESALWSHVLQLPLPFFQNLSSADLMQRVGAISQMRQLISSGLLTAALSLVFSLSNLMLMLIYQAKLAQVAMVFTLVNALLIALLVFRAARQEQLLQQRQAELADMALQAVVGLPQIRVSGSEPFVFAQWSRRLAGLASVMQQGQAISDSLEILARALNPLAQVLIFATLMVLLANRTGNAETPAALVAAFVAFQAAYLAFNSQLSALAVQLAGTLARLLVLWQRSRVVMVAEREPGYGAQGSVDSLRGQVAVVDLRVRYPGAQAPVLCGINLTISEGSYTAITGPSGCGKSTLLRALLRLIEPESGLISIDGTDLRELPVRAYRRLLGVVLQNAALPTGSVFEIVTAGRPFSRDEVWHALEQAALADDVLAMPMQLETILNEGSSGFSGGQRQRLTLARALIGQPRLLLLDEATSALDAATQAAVVRTLEALPITRIVIAHRLSTLVAADQIAVIDAGVVRELGTYGELLKCSEGYVAAMERWQG
jgi:ATP-binding cassette subfamily B protein